MKTENIKKVLIVEDDQATWEMYQKVLHEMFPEMLEIIVVASIPNAKEKIAEEKNYQLYIFDGSVKLGHTCEILHTVFPEKVVVISGEDGYVQECSDKGMVAFNKPFTWSKIRENKSVFEEVLNKIIT
jgi:response regulator of citrate/malate metabolism